MIQRHISQGDVNASGRAQKGPRAIYIHLTRLCNLDCVYCYLDAQKSSYDELRTSEVKRILSEVIAHQPEKVVFTGGEPLMRDDLLELALYFRRLDPDRQIWLCLDSNGIILTTRTAPALVEVFDEIRISLDGFEVINDTLRGRGTFEAALHAIGEVRYAGGLPSLAITATSINITEVIPFVQYMCHEWGIRTMRVNPFRPMGRGMRRRDLLLKETHRLNIVGTLEGCDSDRLPCDGDASCVGTTVNITPQGLVFPCHWLSQKKYYIGDGRNERMNVIYERLSRLRHQLFPKIDCTAGV